MADQSFYIKPKVSGACAVLTNLNIVVLFHIFYIFCIIQSYHYLLLVCQFFVVI